MWQYNYSNELYHWKYISKKKLPNGKYRYYYDKSKNMYDVTGSDYDKKIEEIKNSKEWKDIVARKDPEYVRTDANGKTVYLIDDYLVKKKHPELDVIDDLGWGRKISLNKVTMGSLIAGANDYIRTGQQMLGVVAYGLTEKFKLQQGTYNKQINNTTSEIKSSKSEISKLITKGSKYVSSLMKSYSKDRNNWI